MIRVRKPAQAPEVLRTKGKARRRALERAYAKDARSYDSGTKTFSFEPAIGSRAAQARTLLDRMKGAAEPYASMTRTFLR